MKSNKTRLANDASTAPSSIGSSRMGYRVRSALKSLVRDAMKQEILMDDARFLRRIRFEPLERRELMAADFFEATSNSSQSSWADAYAASQGDFAAPFAKNSRLVAEGEATAAPDLVAFAKALTTAGAKFYGADWCAFCTDQKNLFQEGKAYLPFVEVTNPDRTLNATGTAENITTYPTWKFANGQTVTLEFRRFNKYRLYPESRSQRESIQPSSRFRIRPCVWAHPCTFQSTLTIQTVVH